METNYVILGIYTGVQHTFPILHCFQSRLVCWSHVAHEHTPTSFHTHSSISTKVYTTCTYIICPLILVNTCNALTFLLMLYSAVWWPLSNRNLIKVLVATSITVPAHKSKGLSKCLWCLFLNAEWRSYLPYLIPLCSAVQCKAAQRSYASYFIHALTFVLIWIFITKMQVARKTRGSMQGSPEAPLSTVKYTFLCSRKEN